MYWIISSFYPESRSVQMKNLFKIISVLVVAISLLGTSAPVIAQPTSQNVHAHPILVQIAAQNRRASRIKLTFRSRHVPLKAPRSVLCAWAITSRWPPFSPEPKAKAARIKRQQIATYSSIEFTRDTVTRYNNSLTTAVFPIWSNVATDAAVLIAVMHRPL